MGLQLTVEQGKRVLSAMGYRSVPDVPAKIAGRLRGIPEMNKAEYTVPTDPDDRKLFERIKDAAAEGEEIEVLSEKGDTQMNSTSQPKARNPKTNKPAKEPVARDRFGSRLNTETARFNAAVSRKPSTIREIVDRSELNNKKDIGWGQHLQKLIGKGLVVKSEDNKFALAPKQ